MAEVDWEDAIDQYLERMPEAKLELIDGRLIVGNGLVGSRHLLWEILGGYGAEAALALAPRTLWLQAFKTAFTRFLPPAFDDLSALEGWTRQVAYDPCILPAGPSVDGPHRTAQQQAMFGLARAADAGGLGTATGRDVVMWIAPHAVTPDVFFLSRERRHALNARYCEERADVVIEVLLRGHEAQDRDVKRRLYQNARVPEYWLIDPLQETIEFLRLSGDVYHARQPDADGWYRPLWAPGLAFCPSRFWDCFREGRDFPGAAADFFAAEGEHVPLEARRPSEGGLSWGDVLFHPAPDLLPRPVTFEEFASWCPEAKFEGDGRRLIIAGQTGTRNVLGMLLRTFGLVEAAKVLHPRKWFHGLRNMDRRMRSDGRRKEKWWRFARDAANLLRSKGGWRSIAVIGDLTQSDPLNYWSELILVCRDPGSKVPWETYRELHNLERRIPLDLVCLDNATGEERQLVEGSAVEV